MKVKNLVAVAALGLSVFSVASNAAVYRWTFENAGSAFAFLDFDTSNSNFRLFDNSGDSFLSGDTGVNGIAFVANNGQTFNSPTNVTNAYTTGTINMFSLLPALRPSGYNYAYVGLTNLAATELGAGESVAYNYGNIDFNNLGSIALRVNSNNSIILNNPTWVAATSVAQVPEAETSAMMVLGLGILGLAARRRKQA